MCAYAGFYDNQKRLYDFSAVSTIKVHWDSNYVLDFPAFVAVNIKICVCI